MEQVDVNRGAPLTKLRAYLQLALNKPFYSRGTGNRDQTAGKQLEERWN